MPREETVIPAVAWRSLLEARWQARLREVTELSLAYHAVAAATEDVRGDGAERLLRRTVAARRGLADVEEALARLTAGSFGRCEQCGSVIPTDDLAAVPERRYCPACAAGAGAGAVKTKTPPQPAVTVARPRFPSLQ
ncbi:MAG TPA: TraR/DksA C4-type zinc finger protein [Streptosporangiaceae bacterium]|jgi:RNA polymerase-binding transcription factor DksA